MNTFAKSMLSLALGLGMSTSAFAQSGPAPTAPSKADVSKAAPAVPSTINKAHDAHAAPAARDAKAPAKKVVQNKVDSAAVKPAEVKKSESGTAHNAVKDLSKQETPAKPVK